MDLFTVILYFNNENNDNYTLKLIINIEKILMEFKKKCGFSN